MLSTDWMDHKISNEDSINTCWLFPTFNSIITLYLLVGHGRDRDFASWVDEKSSFIIETGFKLSMVYKEYLIILSTIFIRHFLTTPDNLIIPAQESVNTYVSKNKVSKSLKQCPIIELAWTFESKYNNSFSDYQIGRKTLSQIPMTFIEFH